MNVIKRYYIQIFIIYWVSFSGSKIQHTPCEVRVGNGTRGSASNNPLIAVLVSFQFSFCNILDIVDSIMHWPGVTVWVTVSQ